MGAMTQGLKRYGDGAHKERHWLRMIGGAAVIVVTLSVLVDVGRAERAASAKGEGCPGQVTRDGAWTSITPPPGDGYERQIKAYAVNPKNPKVMFIAHDFELFRTVNGGCDWESVFDRSAVPGMGESPVPLGGAAPARARLAIAPSAPDTVYAMWTTKIDTFLAGDAQLDLTMIVSHDGGRQWNEIELGDIAAEMDAYDLHVSPSDPKTVYLSGFSNYWAVSASSLHATKDGGETWDLAYPQTSDRELQATGTAPTDWSHLAVDPADPDVLWILGGRLSNSEDPGDAVVITQPFRSTDGGASWEAIDPRSDPDPEQRLGPFQALQLDRDPGKPTRVAIAGYDNDSPGKFKIFWSDDGGTSWSSFPTPHGSWVPFFHFGDQSLPGMASGKSSKDLVVIGGEGFDVSVYRLHGPTRQWVDMKAPGAPTGYTGMRHIIADRTKRPTFYVWRTGNEYADILKFTP